MIGPCYNNINLQFAICLAVYEWSIMDKTLSGIIYQNNLDLKRFSLMLDNNVQCYKFYWLEALVRLLVRDGKSDISFYEASREMIIQSWYTVSEYHLHMGNLYGDGTRNALERAVDYIQSFSGLSSAAAYDKISAAIDNASEERDFQKILTQLTDDVPYRLLSPFASELKGGDVIWHSDKRLIAYFNLVNNKVKLPYTMTYISAKDKSIHWNEDWARMIIDNYVLILEWIRSKKIRYLQDRNPGVPGIVYKLDPEGTRQLVQVRKLWNAVMDTENVIDIYTGRILNGQKYDIDHFIPWSYLTSDELWDLTPTEKTINIYKSNHLPDWDKYFCMFVENQVQLRNQIQKYEQIAKLFEKCKNKNLNNLWAADIYNTGTNDQFKTVLDENIRPIYNAAKIQGYSVWSLE